MRTHLLRLEVNTGRRDPRMEIECPASMAYLWELFCSLGRANGGLSQQEIAAWQANYGACLTGWELDTLRAIDNVAVQAEAAHKASQQK
jgi:hypothetical protein